MPEKPQILFVCVHNAGRSQMAAAFARRLGGEGVDVRSAGSEPASAIHPSVVDAMLEAGIDLRTEKPRLLDDADVRASDAVITMGCGDACRIYPGKRYEDWKIDDPSGMAIEGVRVVRDEIERRVRALLAEMRAGAASG